MTPQYTQKYTIVCFFNPHDSAYTFHSSDWPLHVTILDTFKTEWSLDTLVRELKKVAASVPKFNVVPIEQTVLGPDKSVPVKLLRLDEGLVTLHTRLLELSSRGSFTYNSPEFVGPGFLPHATDQKGSNVTIGQTYHLNSISLVDMFPGGDHMQRFIVETFALKG